MSTNNLPLSSDTYEIADFMNELKKQFTPIQEQTLFMGIWGYMGEALTNITQNSIIMSSEYSNESIPYKAKFEKNIITHALSLGFTDINAVPATYEIMLGFIESDIEKKMVNNRLVIDKDNPFYIEDFEFHLEYDIIIIRNRLHTGSITYTAQYDISNKNAISNITNPYLTPPTRLKINGEYVILIQCTLRQVSYQDIYRKLLSDNIIENKTINFDFESQLASFEVIVKENNVETHLVPVYEGLTNTANLNSKYCYYSYIDSNNIRIKFTKESYEPSINADITIRLMLTEGSNGNFSFNEELIFTLESERYNYDNLSCTLQSLTDSQFGSDKKSIDELKKIIPREASARGSITNTTDLENFFNMLDTDTNKVYFYKKRDNALERLYYSYIILKNGKNNIIPTNTINLKLKESDFIVPESGNDNLVLDTGKRIIYGTPWCTITNEKAADFVYTTPYMMVINRNPLYVSYYLNIINMARYLDFTSINNFCDVQYICTTANWKREYMTDRYKYKLNINAMQNVMEDVGQIGKLEDGTWDLANAKVHAYVVLYKNNIPYRYSKANLKNFDPSSYIFNFEFEFETKDIMDKDNNIRIENAFDLLTTTPSYGYFEANIKAVLYIVSEQSGNYGREDIDAYVPGLDSQTSSGEYYVVTNIYTLSGGIDWFFNYSHIIASTVKVDKDATTGDVYYSITGVPAIGYDYINTENKIQDLIKQLDKRKEYIDYALNIIEDSFGVDFKFFNTYGPSNTFTIGINNENLNSVQLRMKFRIQFVNTSDSYLVEYIISDIKNYIEDINEITDLHIPNLITLITTKYRDQLVYFEFLDINGYGPGYQHIYNTERESISQIPEFLNIANNAEGTPIIDIEIV